MFQRVSLGRLVPRLSPRSCSRCPPSARARNELDGRHRRLQSMLSCRFSPFVLHNIMQRLLRACRSSRQAAASSALQCGAPSQRAAAQKLLMFFFVIWQLLISFPFLLGLPSLPHAHCFCIRMYQGTAHTLRPLLSLPHFPPASSICSLRFRALGSGALARPKNFYAGYFLHIRLALVMTTCKGALFVFFDPQSLVRQCRLGLYRIMVLAP